MRVLITGANGYIGSRLLPLLIEAGHDVVALVRSEQRFNPPAALLRNITVVVADLLDKEALSTIPQNIDAAYYLVHSMGEQALGFGETEWNAACNFRQVMETTQCQQVIYLGGLASGDELSEHMISRRNVETALQSHHFSLTVLRAGIIIGSGSASFEIIRDLVEKLPIMIAPRWLRSSCQPIGIADILFYLQVALGNSAFYAQNFEIGGPEVMTYQEMLLRFARLRQLKRWIIPVPLLTPRLSSYWLLFVTATNFSIARALVDSLKCDAICHDRSIGTVAPHTCLSYNEALQRAFDRIEQQEVISSWKDALSQSALNPDLNAYITVPQHGCLKEIVSATYTEREKAIKRLWAIGGEHGWYSMNWAWRIRGFIDILAGGTGLRRGRTHPTRLHAGDALDFWRVLVADKEAGRLLLYAEMRLPGEAWLEYTIEGGTVTQTATFRPKGVIGRLYWYLLMPIHYFLFRRLCRTIAQAT